MKKVKVELFNRYAKFHADSNTILALKDTFKYQIPGYVHAPSYQMGEWDGFVSTVSRGKIPTGVFLAKAKEFSDTYHFVVKDSREPIELLPFSPSSKDRPYQIEAINKARKVSATGGIFICATQTGKTHIISRHLQHVKANVVFLVHEITLLEQAKETLEAVTKEEVGVVGGGEKKVRRITVSTVQSLIRQVSVGNKKNPVLIDMMKQAEVVVIDELHLMINESTNKVVDFINPKVVYGLTASLELEKPYVAYPAHSLAGPLVFQYSLPDGIEEGYLKKGIILRLLVPQPRLTVMRAAAETPEQVYAEAITNNRQRNDMIVDIVDSAVRRKHRIVIFAQRLEHIENLVELIHARGVPCSAVTGSTSKKERVSLRNAFEEGRIPVFVVSSVFSHGIRVNTLTMTIDVGAARSANHIIQKYGRGTGAVEGGFNGKVHIDLADTDREYRGNARERSKTLKKLGAELYRIPWEKIRDSDDLIQLLDKKLKKLVNSTSKISS